MILLLDIDGVMVPEKSWKKPEILLDGFPAFSNVAVEALNCLIDSDTKIFITSSHKSKYDLPQWQAIFKTRGIKPCAIYRLPKNTENLSRKEEIINWFKLQNTIESYLILDDDKSLQDLPKRYKDKLIQTSPMVGLRTNDLPQILI